jgi:uncharacterized protein YndB with AHSA1/START domain
VKQNPAVALIPEATRISRFRPAPEISRSVRQARGHSLNQVRVETPPIPQHLTCMSTTSAQLFSPITSVNVTENDSARELVLQRIIHAPREKVYAAWTQPELLQQWFAPKPWTTPIVKLDLRPGGSSLIVMRAPDGSDFPNRGVYLEVVKNEKLVFTDAYSEAWTPSQKPFVTVILTFKEAGFRKTNYTVRVRHWTVGDRAAHEKMGFRQGWSLCTTQLEALVHSIS